MRVICVYLQEDSIIMETTLQTHITRARRNTQGGSELFEIHLEQNLGVGSDEHAVAIAKLSINSILAVGGFEIQPVWCCAGGSTRTQRFSRCCTEGVMQLVRGTVGVFFLGRAGVERQSQ